MRYRLMTSALALAAITAAPPTFAQNLEDENGWTGIYVGSSFGGSLQSNNNGSNLSFDTNLDNTYGDTVSLPTNPNVFAAGGFCSGAAQGAAPTAGCSSGKDAIEYYGNVGFDKQMGHFVLGVFGEFGKSQAHDSVSGFSATPAASYTLTRSMKYNTGLRLRGGYTPNGRTLFYATGGGAYAKIRTDLTAIGSSNGLSTRDTSKAWGWSTGGGVDQKIAKNFSIGLQYLYTNLKADNYVGRISLGTMPATDAFVFANANGTNVKRSDENWRFHSFRATAAFRF